MKDIEAGQMGGIKPVNSQTALFKQIIRGRVGKDRDRDLSQDIAEHFASVVDRVGREQSIDARYGKISGTMYAVLFKALDDFAKEVSSPDEIGAVINSLYHGIPHIETGIWENVEEKLKDGTSLIK